MIYRIEVKDSINEITVVSELAYLACSVDTPTTDSVTSAALLGEWVQDHSETRQWVIQAADVATFTKEVIAATVDAATPSEITFIHIQAVALPAGPNEDNLPAKFNYSIDSGSGAIAMGKASTLTFSNLESNVIQGIVLDTFIARAGRKVVLSVTVGINK